MGREHGQSFPLHFCVSTTIAVTNDRQRSLTTNRTSACGSNSLWLIVLTTVNSKQSHQSQTANNQSLTTNRTNNSFVLVIGIVVVIQPYLDGQLPRRDTYDSIENWVHPKNTSRGIQFGYLWLPLLDVHIHAYCILSNGVVTNKSHSLYDWCRWFPLLFTIMYHHWLSFFALFSHHFTLTNHPSVFLAVINLRQPWPSILNYILLIIEHYSPLRTIINHQWASSTNPKAGINTNNNE